MEDTLQSFDNRQKAVRRKHTRMAKGYVTKLRKDGVFVQTPDSKSGNYALRLLVIALVALFTFKSFVLYWLGTEVYQGHVDALAAGTASEKIGAFLMQIDPITAKIAEVLSPFAG